MLQNFFKKDDHYNEHSCEMQISLDSKLALKSIWNFNFHNATYASYLTE